MRRFLGITGTPGTGKKSVAPLVAEILGIPDYSLNELARSDRAKSGEVDTALLGKKVVAAVPSRAVIYGHLVPYALPPRTVERVVVLRCEPAVLKKRLTSRGYGEEKVRANVEAELIGLLSAESTLRFGADFVAEFDTTQSGPKEAARSVSSLLTGKAEGERYDWTVHYDSALKLKSLFSSFAD